MTFPGTTLLRHSGSDLHLYKRLRGVILVLLFFAVGFFLMRVVFPHVSFAYKKDLHSLANTITRPESLQSIRSATSFSVVTPLTIDTAKITITLDDSSPLATTQPLSLYKSYGGFFYPPAEKTQENPPQPPAQLFKENNGVFVTSQKEKHFFDTPETLRASGYSFSMLHDTLPQEIARYKKGKIFSLSSYHLPDTIYYTTDTKRYFQITPEKTLREITPPPASSAIIAVRESAKTTHATCTLIKNFLRKKTLSCTIHLAQLSDLPGKRYLFMLPNLTPKDIKEIHVTLSSAPTSANFSLRLQTLKHLIRDRFTL